MEGGLLGGSSVWSVSDVQVRAAELAAVQRLEAAERRKKEERERRIRQALQQAAEEEALRKQVATQAYARDFLQGLHPPPPHTHTHTSGILP